MGTPNQTNTEYITLAGGCFWCLEATFELVNGVESVTSGYTGGHLSDPSYEEVCSETTGHAEAVQIEFNPSTVTFQEILGVFFSIHDPTTLNRQGYDIGSRYRSAIFWHTEHQKKASEKTVDDLSRQDIWGRPIVTQLEPLSQFFPAEEYHQEYFRKNPELGYCQVIIAPKVAKLRKYSMQLLKPEVLT